MTTKEKAGSKCVITSINVKDPSDIVLKISTRMPISRSEPDDYVSHVKVSICRYDGSTDEDTEIGEAVCLYVDNDLANNQGISEFAVMDAHSDELLDVHSALFDPETGFCKHAILERTPDIIGRSALYIESIYLLPEYRGFGWGLLSLLGIIDEVGKGAALVVLPSLPIRFQDEELNQRLALHPLTEEEERQAIARLIDYFAAIGFDPVPGSDNLLYLSTAYCHPSVSDLLEKMKQG